MTVISHNERYGICERCGRTTKVKCVHVVTGMTIKHRFTGCAECERIVRICYGATTANDT